VRNFKIKADLGYGGVGDGGEIIVHPHTVLSVLNV